MLPWRWGERRDLIQAASDWRTAAVRTADLDTAAEAGRRWLELAAAIDARAVVQRRVERLEKAVALQRKRLELGEISGMELIQIELEQARWSAKLSTAEQELELTRESLSELCGDRCDPPQPGDLKELANGTATPDAGRVPERFESAPVWRSIAARSELDMARWKSIGQSAAGFPELEAEWERFPALDGLPAYDAAGIRLRFPIPVGSDVRAARAEAAYRAREVSAGLRAQGERLHRRLAGLFSTASASENRLAELGGILEREGQAEHALAEQFRLGAASYLVYIDGLDRLDDLRLDVVKARLELLHARLELAALVADGRSFPLPAMERGGDE